MKKNRKLASILLAFTMMISLSACAVSRPETKSSDETLTETRTETTSTEETTAEPETETEPETEETLAPGQTYVSEELKNCLSWPGKSVSALGIQDYYISADGESISLSGRFLGIPVNYGTAYLRADENGEVCIDNLYLLPEGYMYDIVGDMIAEFGAPTGEGEEPYSSANGGAVSWISFSGNGIDIGISQGENNDYFKVTAEPEKEGSAKTGNILPSYEYTGSDPVEYAITGYMLDLNEKSTAVNESPAAVPAFCYFKAARSEDGELMVYGNFWVHFYTGAGRTFYSGGGSAYPGVLYLAADEDGRYEVTKFDRVRDGADMDEDIARITDGDPELLAQYQASEIASQDPLLSARAEYLAYYASQNGLDMDIYQDPGQDPIQFRTEGDSTELSPGPWQELYESELQSLEPETISLDMNWEFADFSAIHTGTATLYHAKTNRNGYVVGVNAGHGTQGGPSVQTYCHPDGSPKVTGGTTAAGSITAMAVSSGMTFYDGTPERDVNLQEALILKELLLEAGYDVLMIRESDDVQLDNVARTVICNNVADCHIAIHWDGDGLSYDKGCFAMTVPDGLKSMYPVSEIWPEDNRLGESLIQGLTEAGAPIHGNGISPADLTQTSFSSIPSVDMELGNAASDHSEEALRLRAEGLLRGLNIFFGL